MGFKTKLEERAGIYPETEGDYKKTRWLFLRPGNYTIRVLDEQPHAAYTHWVSGVNVECLGDDGSCPFCEENKTLVMKYPDSYNKQGTWNPFRKTGYVNVLDKTPVKTCVNPECLAESSMTYETQQYPAACWNCQTSLMSVEAEPSNMVKVFSRSKSVFDQMAAIETSLLDSGFASITEYDIVLMVVPHTSGSNVTIVPKVTSNEPIGDLPEEKYDLESVVLKFTALEMMDLRRGTKVGDIFAARRAEEAISEKAEIPFGGPLENEAKTEIADASKEYLEQFG